MKYDIVKPGEEEIVKTLWKSEQLALGIPYMTDIVDYIAENHFYCIRDGQDNIVAYCTYDIMKRRPEVRVSALLVNEDYRGRGYSKELIYQVYKDNDNLIDKLHFDFVAEAREGVPNNSFYDKISNSCERSQKKTMVVRTYKLDVDKIRQWGPSKWSSSV